MRAREAKVGSKLGDGKQWWEHKGEVNMDFAFVIARTDYKGAEWQQE